MLLHAGYKPRACSATHNVSTLCYLQSLNNAVSSRVVAVRGARSLQASVHPCVTVRACARLSTGVATLHNVLQVPRQGCRCKRSYL